MVKHAADGTQGRENEAPNLKIIWLRQHQQMRVIFSKQWRELKSLTINKHEMNCKKSRVKRVL